MIMIALLLVLPFYVVHSAQQSHTAQQEVPTAIVEKLPLALFKHMLTFLLGDNYTVSVKIDPDAITYFSRKNGFGISNGGAIIFCYKNQLCRWCPYTGAWFTKKIDKEWSFHSIEDDLAIICHKKKKFIKILETKKFDAQTEYELDHQQAYFTVAHDVAKNQHGVVWGLHPLVTKSSLSKLYIMRHGMQQQEFIIPGAMPPIKFCIKTDRLVAHACTTDRLYVLDTKNNKLQSIISLSDREISDKNAQQADVAWDLYDPQTHHATLLKLVLQNGGLILTTRDIHDATKNIFPLCVNFLQNLDERVGELFFSRCYSLQQQKIIPCLVSFIEKRAHVQKSKDEGSKNEHAHEAVATCWDLETGTEMRTLRTSLDETESFDTLGACSATGRIALCANPTGYQTATHHTDLQYFVKRANVPGYFNSHVMFSPSGDWALYCSQMAHTKADEEAGKFTVLPYTLCYFGDKRIKRMMQENPRCNMRAHMLYLAALQNSSTPLPLPQKMQEALGMHRSLKEKVTRWWENKNASS